MSDSQESLTDLYGITALVVLVAFVLFFFGGTLTRVFLSLFRGTYEPDGQNQQVDFSSVSEIFGYVPQIKLKAFPFPFLACNIDQIDQVSLEEPLRCRFPPLASQAPHRPPSLTLFGPLLLLRAGTRGLE
jgi:hypothetical protein